MGFVYKPGRNYNRVIKKCLLADCLRICRIKGRSIFDFLYAETVHQKEDD